MEKSALILMATYNGEKYLAQQIDSILKQSHTNLKLIIRDDGSIDNTVSIIERYAETDERVELLKNFTDQHGAYLNFWSLVSYAKENCIEYDYVFFSDQDDIWEKSKIETMIRYAEKKDRKKPLLLYADMRVIDQNNNVTFKSLDSIMGIGEIHGYSLFFTHGFLWGCDICINNRLFCDIPCMPLDHESISIVSHDNYMGKYALLYGEIVYINKVLINHRRHNSNTTGSYYMKLSLLSTLKKCLFRLDELGKTHAGVYNQTLIFLDQLSNYSRSKYKIVDRIRKAITRGGIRGCVSIFKLGVKRKQIARTIGIYFIMLTKKYKKYLLDN